MKKNVYLWGLASLFFTAAHAQTSHNWSVGVSASTLGAGANVAYKFNDTFKLRGIINYFHFNRGLSTSNFDTKGKLQFFTAGLLADLHPLQNGLRLTAGAVYNNTNWDGKHTAKKSVTINGRTYTPQQLGEIDATFDFRPIAPYVGIGYDSNHNQPQAGFGFTADAGVLFQGSARGKINRMTGLAANNPLAIQDAKDEVLKEVNKRGWIKAYPVISLGINYKF